MYKKVRNEIMSVIKKLHHNAYRCIDSEETRKFYEDFLNLKLVKAFNISNTFTGRNINALHTFYSMNDNSYLAFFEILGDSFKYKKWHDFDLHIALEVDKTSLLKYFHKGKSLGIETRGISDHGFIESIYFRDPNGYVIELTSPNNISNLTDEDPHKVLDVWNSQKNV